MLSVDPSRYPWTVLRYVQQFVAIWKLEKTESPRKSLLTGSFPNRAPALHPGSLSFHGAHVRRNLTTVRTCPAMDNRCKVASSRTTTWDKAKIVVVHQLVLVLGPSYPEGIWSVRNHHRPDLVYIREDPASVISNVPLRLCLGLGFPLVSGLEPLSAESDAILVLTDLLLTCCVHLAGTA